MQTSQASLFDQTAQREEAPSFSMFRELVDHIQSDRDAALIKLLYLGAYRVSEVSTKVAPYETAHKMTRTYGKALRYDLTDFRVNDTELIKVLLLDSAIAKRTKERDGQEYLTFKQIALPLSKEHEPWALDLLIWARSQGAKSLSMAQKKLPEERLKDQEYMGKLGDELLHRSLRFHLCRPAIEYIIRQNLRSLLPEKNKHNLKNPLRHWRLSHLAELYDFDGFDLTMFAGWTYGSSMAGQGASGMLDSYLHLSWKKYFKKLLVPLSEVR